METISEDEVLCKLQRPPGGDHRYDFLTHAEFRRSTNNKASVLLTLTTLTGENGPCTLSVQIGYVPISCLIGDEEWKGSTLSAVIKPSEKEVFIGITAKGSSTSHYWIRDQEYSELSAWLSDGTSI